MCGMGTGITPLPWAPALKSRFQDEKTKFRVEGFYGLIVFKHYWNCYRGSRVLGCLGFSVFGF